MPPSLVALDIGRLYRQVVLQEGRGVDDVEHPGFLRHPAQGAAVAVALDHRIPG